jgi:hypothetical protein
LWTAPGSTSFTSPLPTDLTRSDRQQSDPASGPNPPRKSNARPRQRVSLGLSHGPAFSLFPQRRHTRRACAQSHPVDSEATHVAPFAVSTRSLGLGFHNGKQVQYTSADCRTAALKRSRHVHYTSADEKSPPTSETDRSSMLKARARRSRMRCGVRVECAGACALCRRSVGDWSDKI